MSVFDLLRRIGFGLLSALVCAALLAVTPLHAQVRWQGSGSLPQAAQDAPRFSSLDVTTFVRGEDLPSTFGIVALVEGPSGHLWISGGANSGLLRFDGYEFKSITHTPGDPTSLSNPWVETLFVGSDSIIWIGTHGGGLNRFDPALGTFVHYRHDPDDPKSISGDLVTKIVSDGRGGLWVGTHQGLNRMDQASGSFTRYRHDPEDSTSLSNDQVRSLFVDRDGTLWIGTGSPWGDQSAPGAGGLNRFDPETETFKQFLHDPADEASLFDNHVTALFEDSRGVFWVGAMGDVLHRMDRDAGTFERYRYDPAFPGTLVRERRRSLPAGCDAGACGLITFIDEDADGILWIGSRERLLRYDVERGHARVETLDAGSSPQWWATTVTKDGARWVGSFDALRRVRTIEPLPHFVHDPADTNSLGHNRVFDMYADRNGMLWIATWGGLDRYDPMTGRFAHFRRDPGNPFTLSSDSAFCITEDSYGDLWIGTWQGGLNRLDQKSGRITRYLHDPGDPTSLSHDWVLDLAEDHEGQLWIATWGGGLNRFDRQTGAFMRFRHDATDSSSLSWDNIFAVHVDSEGTLRAAANTDLNRYNSDTATFTRLGTHKWRYDFIEDHAGRLWLADELTGLHLLDKETGAAKQYLAPQRLPGNEVAAGVEDALGYIWVTTFDGQPDSSSKRGALARFDRDRKSFRIFGAADGVPDMPLNVHGAVEGPQGILYFGGQNGFFALDPSSITERAPPRAVLEGLRVFNDPVEPGPTGPLREPLERASEIAFSHHEHHFTVEFAGLDLSSSPLMFQYMLEPHDGDWVDAQSQRSARYSRVAPGDYTFRVRVARHGEAWSEQTASIAVVVLPPWWRSWWAYVLYVLFFIGAVISVDRVQRRRLLDGERRQAASREARLRAELAEERTQYLEALDQTKSRFIANISHEFRTPLTLLLGPLQDALDQDDRAQASEYLMQQVPSMHRNAGRLLRLVGQLLDLSKLEAGSMHLHPSRIDLTEFLRELVLAFAPLAERDGLTLLFDTEHEALWGLVDSDKLEKIVSNLLANAIKFTMRGGKVRVGLTATGDGAGCILTVSDTGRGIPAVELPRVFDRFHQVDSATTREHEGTGLGLALVKELVELHGGSVEVESQRGFGTTFTIRLPLQVQGAEAQASAPTTGRMAPGGAPLPPRWRFLRWVRRLLIVRYRLPRQEALRGRCSSSKTMPMCAPSYAATCRPTTASSKPPMAKRGWRSSANTDPIWSSAT